MRPILTTVDTFCRARQPSLVAFLALLVLACRDTIPPETTYDPPPGTYTISLSDSALTIQAGMGAQTTTVYLVRTNFAAPVTLTVGDGEMPPGVTASFSPNPATGNSSALTFTVGAAAVPGNYALTIYGDDSVDGANAFAPLSLTVMPAPAPAYTLSLSAHSASGLSIVQGGGAVETAVNVSRTNFSGNVTLSVENLPVGVNAGLYPRTLISGNSSRLFLWAEANVSTGTFANVLVRGVASGMTDRTALLTLSITKALFVLTLSSPRVSIAQGAATPTTTVNVVPDDFTGPVTLYLGWLHEDHDILPPGVTAAFSPNPATGNSSVLTLTVGAAAVPGVYELFVSADAPTGPWAYAPLTLTVTAAEGEGMLVSQWAVGATASAEYTSGEWSAMQATGAPNVTGCTDDPNAWATSSQDGVDWLEVTYAQPVRPSEIRIHEVYGVGSIVRVEVKDASGGYHTVYSTQPVAPQACPRVLTIPVTSVSAKVSAVRVSVDQRVLFDWNEIDAVQLIGYR